MPKSPKILFYQENYTWRGGDTVFLCDVITALCADGWHCIFAYPTPAPSDYPLKSMLPSSVLFLPIPMKTVTSIDNRIKVLPMNYPYELYRRYLFNSNIRIISGILEKEKPDVVHINNGGWPGADSCRAATIAARQANCPRIVFAWHNLVAKVPRISRGWEQRVLSEVCSSADVMLTFSEINTRDFISNCNVPISLQNRVKWIHYGITNNSFKEQKNIERKGLKVCFIGSFESRKAPDIVIKVAERLSIQNMSFDLYGDGPMMGLCRNLSQNLKNVRLHGFIQNASNYLSDYDVLLLPSRCGECLPYVILEAMRDGIPVISTPIAGIPELVIDGKTGYLIQVDDIEAIAGAIMTLRDSNHRKMLGLQARQRFEKLFKFSDMMGNLKSIYNG